jgi:hypothetical protein
MKIKTNKEVLAQLDKLGEQKEGFVGSLIRLYQTKTTLGFFLSIGSKKVTCHFFLSSYLQVLLKKGFPRNVWAMIFLFPL